MKTLLNQQKKFTWQGTTLQGQSIQGEITAPSINLARASLTRQGIHLASLRSKKFTLPFIRTSIKAVQIIYFFRQLSTLIHAGIPLSQAMNLLIHQAEPSPFLTLLSSLKEDIHAGKSFAYSLKKFPKQFDAITWGLIQAAEKSGTLDSMLERIADHKEKIHRYKTKLQQVLFYPFLIFAIGIGVTLLMLTQIVPRFAELFTHTHHQLPLLTRSVICLADFLHHYLSVFLLLFFFLISMLYYFRTHFWVRFSLDKTYLTFPLIRTLAKKIILARFTRNLATLFLAGLPITEALSILSLSMGNVLYSRAVQTLATAIAAGQQLNRVMRTGTLFPPMMVQMIKIGEESGALDKMLYKIADFYEADIDHIIAQSSRLLEPLIMVVLGVLIGSLILAIYLPIFQLGAVI